jgi:cob(I)alamin adenosyltransferase
LLELQQELFDLGSELATKTEYSGMWKAEARHVERLEKLCDEFGEGLPELQSFIIPGGERGAALLHLARTVSRRAERSLVELANREGKDFNWETVKYINRFSDLMFILSRYRLKAVGIEQPLWVKERERGIS